MSYIIPKPYQLTDAEIASVLSTNTVSAKLTDAGIAAALSSATVGAKMAGIATGDVGSFVMAKGGLNLPGDTVAGSSLQYSNGGQSVSPSNPALAGTWRCMGYTTNNNTGGGSYASVFLRIA